MMEVVYHPLVRQDVSEVRRYYRGISPRLADEFRDELRAVVDLAAQNPIRFAPTAHGFRRANMKRFPYHILYDVQGDVLRIMLVRHHKRHPRYGLDRA